MAQPRASSVAPGDGQPGPAVPMDAAWQDTGPEAAAGERALVIDVDGFEGPLDLLLHLARDQKVDLTQISVLDLARQYLAFVESARALRIELAADYLVMAAWLAYLKSRLLVPQPKAGEEPSGEEMAAVLQFRLRRLEAMREAAGRLINGNRLGRDIFARGAPETVVVERTVQFEATLYDLLSAYAANRQRAVNDTVQLHKRAVWSLAEARDILVRLIGEVTGWTPLDTWLLAYVPTPTERRSALASAFAASLEMARERMIEIRQDRPFSPIMMRGAGDPAPGQKNREAAHHD